MGEWFNKGEAALARGNAEQARTYFTRAAKFSKDRPNPLVLLRLAYATLKAKTYPSQIRHEKALKLYNRIVSEYPNFTGAELAQFRMAKSYRSLNRAEEAVKAYEAYLSRYANGEYLKEARMGYAEALVDTGDTRKALAIFEELLKQKLDPEFKSKLLIQTASARLLLAREGELPKAQKRSKAELAELPQLPDDELNRIENRLNLGQLKVGENVENPGLPQAQWDTIRNAINRGKLGSAVAYIKPWLESEDASSKEMGRRWLAWAKLLEAKAKDLSPAKDQAQGRKP